MKLAKVMVAIVMTIWLLSGCGRESDYKLLQTNTQNLKGHKLSGKSLEYLIQPQDRLQIVLYKDPSAAMEVTTDELGQSMSKDGILVDSKGFVRLPLIGKVHVAGMTQGEAAEKITKLYKKYLNTPSIYLEVLNKRVFVLGEVNKPGPITLDKEKMNLLEAIAFAGDLTDSAVRDNVIIVSNDKDGLRIRSVDLTRFDKLNRACLVLRPNDVVYVQPDSWKEFRVGAKNYLAPFEAITKLAAPFVTIKYLND